MRKWTWINSDGTPQTHTFDTPDAAMVAMEARMGVPVDLMRLYVDYGFTLALVEITIKVVMVLQPPKEAEVCASPW